MNKFIKIFSVIGITALISGCTPPLTKVTTCTQDNDQSKSGYKIHSVHKIYSNNDIVKKVYSEDVLTSENTTIIAYFEKNYNDRYKEESTKYKGFSYNVKKTDGKIDAKLTINYNKVNMNDYVKNNPAMKSYVNKDNKLTLKGAKTMYESLGAKCE